MNDMTNAALVNEKEKRENAIFDALARLPQADHFKPEHLRRFVDCYLDDPRAMWHVYRLSGIGGSEIGVAVSALRGEHDAFGATPADIIREKLLVFPPKKTTLAMRKGIVAETCIRQFFTEDYQAVRDQQAHALLESGNFARPYPWMRYSPDDIVIIGGRRYLVDYKHPGEAALHDGISLRYISQLHMGRMLLDHNSIRVDGMLLVQYPERGNDLVVSDIPFDDSIADDIIRGGEMVWTEILAGRVPPFDFRDDIPRQLSSDDIAEISELSDRFVKNKVMGEALLSEADALQSKIKDIILPRAIEGNSKLKFNALNISVSEKFAPDVASAALGDDAQKAVVPVYSADRMAEYLAGQGVDMSRFETGKTRIDEARLRDLMAERALSERQFTVQNLRMTLSCTEGFKEAAQDAASGARDNFKLAVESKSPARKTVKP